MSSRRLPLAAGCIFRVSFAQENPPISSTQLICPNCNSANTRRSRRRTALDYLFSYGGVLPWRCGECAARFYARAMPVRDRLHAHCGICGNLELQRISAEHVPGMSSLIWRLLRIPALRCEPCRHKFFSVRPLMREEQRAEATAAK